MDNEKKEQEDLEGADNLRILRFEAEHIKKIQVVRDHPVRPCVRGQRE